MQGLHPGRGATDGMKIRIISRHKVHEAHWIAWGDGDAIETRCGKQRDKSSVEIVHAVPIDCRICRASLHPDYLKLSEKW